MNLPLFIARKIYRSDGSQQEVSRPAILIATIGVAIGLAVMIVTVSVVFGFKHTIRDKVVGFGSHIQVTNFLAHDETMPLPVSISDSLMQVMRDIPGVRHVARFSMTQGLLKTDDDFLGVAFKGVGDDYDLTFLRENLVEGEMPQFSTAKSNYQLLISQMMADKLKLKVGDRVFAYFIGKEDRRTNAQVQRCWSATSTSWTRQRRCLSRRSTDRQTNMAAS